VPSDMTRPVRKARQPSGTMTYQPVSCTDPGGAHCEDFLTYHGGYGERQVGHRGTNPAHRADDVYGQRHPPDGGRHLHQCQPSTAALVVAGVVAALWAWGGGDRCLPGPWRPPVSSIATTMSTISAAPAAIKALTQRGIPEAAMLL
jgi:hypothetical protein